MQRLVAAIDHAPTSIALSAERAFLGGARRLLPRADRGSRQDQRLAARALWSRDRARWNRCGGDDARRTGRRRRRTRPRRRRGTARPRARGRARRLSMRILVTRPEPDAARTAAKLSAAGHEVAVDSLLADRAHRLRSAARRICGPRRHQRECAARGRREPSIAKLKSLPFFALGVHTANAARLAGFVYIDVAGGDARLARRGARAPAAGGRARSLSRGRKPGARPRGADGACENCDRNARGLSRPRRRAIRRIQR